MPNILIPLLFLLAGPAQAAQNPVVSPANQCTVQGVVLKAGTGEPLGRRLEAITGGSNALAEALVKVEDASGTTISATAAREDVVVASVEAMIEAINKVLLRRRFHEVSSGPIVQSD